MRTAWLHGAGDVRVTEGPVPEPGPGEALVKVTAVGLCGSDLHWYGEGAIGDVRLSEPIVPGHETAGVVMSGALTGRRVAVDPAIPCHRCELCVEGHPNLCADLRFAGYADTPGGLREYLTWPEHRLHVLPDAIGDAEGALLEPLGVAIHALDLGRVRLGMSVAVVGCGPIGLMLVRLARLAGATRVLAADPLPHRREAALRMGADDVFDEPVAGAHVAFEVAGNDAAVDLAIGACRPGARLVLVGIPETDTTTFRASPARRRGLTIALARRMKEVYPRAMSVAAAVDLTSLVTDVFPLEKAGEAFAHAAARAGLKTVVGP
ncbi:zinc-dependent alcohol dehydrogenase [Actinorhabdospora filicis]|nr:alcohol dehydrogenase catalytic domain-containing protein [Actinorhabdospora filicis]